MVILVAAASLGTGKATGQTISSAGGGDLDVTAANAMPPFASYPLGENYYLNWSELPFTINVNQSLGYNSNILGLTDGQPNLPSTPARGDLFSTTILGISTKAYLGGQQFFADGSYGITKYRTDVADDTHQYSLDSGVNWTFTSRCSGRVVGAMNEYQSPIEEQVGGGINSITASSLNESAKCLLTGYVSAILDSGLSDTKNSNIVDALNDYNSKFVRGGFEYALSGLDTLRALTTLTQRQFTDRNGDSIFVSPGLASGTTQVDYQLEFHDVYSPKLTFDGMIGLSDITDDAFFSPTGTGGHQTSPIYSAALTFQATPKVSFGLATSRTVGAPTSIIANVEISQSNSATVAYQLSPKISMQAGLARSTSTGGNSAEFSSRNASSSTSLTAFYKVSYNVSPFLIANAGFQYSDRNESSSEIKDGVFTLSLIYRPQ